MQVEVDVKCMQTNFDGCGLSSFGDFFAFKNGEYLLIRLVTGFLNRL